MMTEYIDLISRVPEQWYDIKDCWMAACKMITLQLGMDDKPLDLNAYFYYNRENKEKYPEGFEGVIRRNISIAEDRETNREVLMEYDFLKQFVGLNCTGKACSDKEAYEFAEEAVEQKKGCILWIDCFYAEWNGLYDQVHFPHCVDVLKTGPQKCVIFDAFQKEAPCFEVDTDRLFAMTNFVNVFEVDKDYKGFKNPDEMIDLFFNNFILRYESISEYIDILDYVIKDLEKIKSRIYEELDNENTIKLIMRIFVNQYQKATAQLNCFKETTTVTQELIILCEEINSLWKLCAGIFAKICYLSNEKKRIKYNLLCDSMKEIKNKLIIFNNIILREVA